MKNPDRQPFYHHYLPAFYQSRWSGQDRKIWKFTKVYGGKVSVKRTSPRVSGADEELYSDYSAPSERAQAMETSFMAPLDTLANEALVALETDNSAIRNDPRLRSAWSRFLMSLMMRMPDHLETLTTGLTEEFARQMPELEVAYEANKGAGDPATFAAYMETRPPGDLRSWMLSVLRTLMDHALVGEMINNMRWFVRTIDGPAEFITSDRPVITLYEFSAPDSYIILPIGPKSAFVAVNNDETRRRIEACNEGDWAKNLNTIVAGAAVKFVFARNDAARDFIVENLGTRPRATIFEHLVRFRQVKNSQA